MRLSAVSPWGMSGTGKSNNLWNVTALTTKWRWFISLLGNGFRTTRGKPREKWSHFLQKKINVTHKNSAHTFRRRQQSSTDTENRALHKFDLLICTRKHKSGSCRVDPRDGKWETGGEFALDRIQLALASLPDWLIKKQTSSRKTGVFLSRKSLASSTMTGSSVSSSRTWRVWGKRIERTAQHHSAKTSQSSSHLCPHNRHRVSYESDWFNVEHRRVSIMQI